jgi:alpha-beta hydrolase superfamily lysophospholipase
MRPAVAVPPTGQPHHRHVRAAGLCGRCRLRPRRHAQPVRDQVGLNPHRANAHGSPDRDGLSGAIRTSRAYDHQVGQQPVVRDVHIATGVALRYLEQGDPAGRAILLLHPWGESLRCFDRLLALLPPSLRVLSLDQRGHGGADKPASGYELASFAADVEAFMETAGLAAAVLVGSSSGGYVAQQVA